MVQDRQTSPDIQSPLLVLATPEGEALLEPLSERVRGAAPDRRRAGECPNRGPVVHRGGHRQTAHQSHFRQAGRRQPDAGDRPGAGTEADLSNYK